MKNPHFKKNIEYDIVMGGIKVQQQHWQEARIFLEEALSVQPDNPFVLTHLGVVALAQGNNTLAKEYFERAIKENQFEILGRLNLASLYKGDGNLTGAMRLYKEILDLEPNNEIALVELIQIYLQQGDRENILKIARVLSKHSHNPVVLRNVGLIFQRYGNQ